MKFTDPLRDASFAKRINRFLASVQIDGREEYAHVPNSGRMAELLTAGRSIKLRERQSRVRKTRYDLCLVDFSGFWVSIDARPPGILMAESIEKNAFPDFAKALNTGCSMGLKVFAFNCEVNEKEITLKDRIPVIP